MIQTSSTGKVWSTVYKTSWLRYWSEVTFAKTRCRYLKISKTDGGVASIAEINVLLADGCATGIEETVTTEKDCKEVSHVRFFTVNGMEVATPTKGLYIKKTTYADGHTEARAINY